MIAAITLLIAGLAVLVVGAEMIVRGGSAIAARMGIPPVIIGLTFVAIGTSAPELAVGIEAAIQGEGSIAVGNIAGTNTVNILLILGLSAALRPLALGGETLRLELPAIVLASLAMAVLAWDGSLTRSDGLLLLAMAAGFTLLVIRSARRASAAVKREFAAEFSPGRLRTVPRRAMLDALTLAIGVAVIVYGAQLLVDGAVTLARLWHVSDAFIGLTVVAIGTSAPELATTIISTLRGNRDIAVGNLIGSSVYNILAILGITCLVPATPILVDAQLIQIDIPVMAAVSILCVPVFFSGRRVSRVEGMMFVGAYLAYLAYLIVART